MSHVLSMRLKLELMKDMAHTNLKSAQDHQKQLAKEVSEEEFPDWKASGYVQPTLGSQLSETEKGEMKEMLEDFDDVLQGKPGKTVLSDTCNPHQFGLSSSSSTLPYSSGFNIEKL